MTADKETEQIKETDKPEPEKPAPAAEQPKPKPKDRPDPTRYGDWEKKGRCIDF